MPRALKTCSTAGCPELVASGRCAACRRQAEQERGSAAARGYGHRWSTTTREAYLTRHPLCVVRGPRCTVLAEVPDHHPVSRRDLVAAGVRDPDADHRLRPVCRRCHSRETARHQPGGWAAGHR